MSPTVSPSGFQHAANSSGDLTCGSVVIGNTEVDGTHAAGTNPSNKHHYSLTVTTAAASTIAT